jgi:hypothetical protein
MSNALVGVVIEDTQAVASYLDVRQIAILASLLIPLGVSLLSKKTASDGIKALLNITGSALVSALAIWINPNNQPVTVWLFINTFLAALAASFISYKALWKPSGVTEAIATKTANIGLGTPDYEAAHAADSVIDDDEHAVDGEDIGTFDPGTETEDDVADPDDELDSVVDPGDVPVLDEEERV